MPQDLLAVCARELHVEHMSEGEYSTTAQRLESSEAIWRVPSQPAALTAFKIK